MKRLIQFTICMLLTISFIHAQETLSTKSKKAIEAYNNAINLFGKWSYNEAEIEALKAIKHDNKFVEAYMLLSYINADNKKPKEAIDALNKAITINPDFFPNNFITLADLELSVGYYEDAKKHYEKYLSYQNIQEVNKKTANRNMRSCNFAMDAIKNPVPFNPINLGDSINTGDAEYSPSLTVDENTIIFTVRFLKNSNTYNGNTEEEDFFESTKINGKWSKAINLGPPINTQGNEGAQCLSSDGKTLVFTACNRSDGVGSCDLYISFKKGNKWTTPVNMGGNVNSNKWDSQPSISPDGTTIYFASARPGGKGGSDIWKINLLPNGQWSRAINLGDTINTDKDENSPFMHFDNQTLYFCSDGHTGMGGRDLYYSRKDSSGKWGIPVNLGYPINTFADEFGLIVNAKGDTAYFSSDKEGGKGKLDLYSFELNKANRPLPVTYLKGIVYNSETKQKIEARFELINLKSSKVVYTSYSDPIKGDFLVTLPTENDYALNVSKEGYLFYSDNFTLSGNWTNIEPFIKNVPLVPINIGGTVVLKNIFFETAKYDLKKESYIELNKLIAFLKTNVNLKIEISGHTDNIGGKEYNQTLSENRANSVYSYLIDKGIDSKRLTFKGYGDTKPIDTNDTDLGRSNNRRTEFKIISQ